MTVYVWTLLLAASYFWVITSGASNDFTLCFEDHCYLRSDSRMSWVDGYDYCVKREAVLPSIHSYAQNMYIINSVCKKEQCWIGLTDQKREGVWVWVDGTDFDYSKWRKGEPSNSAGREDHVHLHTNGEWNDGVGSDSLYIVCETQSPRLVQNSWSGYVNSYDGGLDWTTSSNRFVTGVYSVHSNQQEDRKWKFRHGSISNAQCVYRRWTNDINDYDGKLSFSCNSNEAISGFRSTHDNHREDRRWDIQCCTVWNLKLVAMGLTEYLNDWDGVLDFSCQNDEVLVGVYSEHSNGKEDRRWKFRCSRLTAPPTRRPTPAPSVSPTPNPTIDPSNSPTSNPTNLPTYKPTASPSVSPTISPTIDPSNSPTVNPTNWPTYKPTPSPSVYPTINPTIVPSNSPTLNPTNWPTYKPTPLPSASPTINPTNDPSNSPTLNPTNWPTLDCVLIEEWTQARSNELCPEQVHHAYGVGICDRYDHPDYQRRLEFALANQLYSSCNHKCLYDYDTHNSSKPYAFKWTGRCYNVATGYFCFDEKDEMRQSHMHAATLCETTDECVERIEWTQEVAKGNCPDGYSNGEKGYGTSKVCPYLVRLPNGFYEKADVLYEASFNRSLANRMFLSCSAKCLYDIENQGVVYQWKGDCWLMQTDWACITNHVSEYEWAMKYLGESICAITTPAPVIAPCAEREQDWTDEIANQICPADAMGATKKGVDAIVCTGYEDFQYRLDHSLANRVFLTCDSWCVYDIYKMGYEAFIWNAAGICWKPVTRGLCISKSRHRRQMTDYIQNILCESNTPEPTEAPTCTAQREWSEDLMDSYCSVEDTSKTYKHYSNNSRAAVPCSGFEERAGDLLKSLAMRMYAGCSSWCVYDFSSNALLAWKWSNKHLCWNLLTWGSCHWDYSNRMNSTDWNEAKRAITLMCTHSPTPSPTGCVPLYDWTADRAGELCPSLEDIDADKSFGVVVCDDDASSTRQFALELSLANNFFDSCSSWCVYDYGTVVNNIMTDSEEYGGFVWKNTCWKWVTGWACFTTFLSEFERVSERALDQCEVKYQGPPPY